jgi:predicted protein tyrosine phosphatase
MRDLIRLGLLTTRGGEPDASGWPVDAVQDYTSYGDALVLAPHPHDAGVLLGGIGALRSLPKGVDAVVSLCRLGRAEVPAASVTASDHVEMWLIDSDDPDRNAYLDFVLRQAVQVVADLRHEGRTVLLHCVQAQSRTPTVAALYSARQRNVPLQQALDDVQRALPGAHPNPAFQSALHRLSPPAGLQGTPDEG